MATEPVLNALYLPPQNVTRPENHLDAIIGHSAAARQIQVAVAKAAASASTVLLRGESGTGKGLVARIIHAIGPRKSGPFVKFNCAALPETLAESELFGHEKGAFTGAMRRKPGRFELANGGTIFLDEIGKLNLSIQSKLLRVVEEKEYERLGGTQTMRTDVKIIAATNLEIEKAIAAETFREDLFYRLNIIPIALPPLRDRIDDIPLLAEHFVRKTCEELGVAAKRLDPDVLELFASYRWPGNIRELEAMLHRAIVMTSGETISTGEFQTLFATRQDSVVVRHPHAAALIEASVARLDISSAVYDDILSTVDRRLVMRALEISGGRIREAARRLGVARNTLKSKIQKYNIAAGE